MLIVMHDWVYQMITIIHRNEVGSLLRRSFWTVHSFLLSQYQKVIAFEMTQQRNIAIIWFNVLSLNTKTQIRAHRRPRPYSFYQLQHSNTQQRYRDKRAVLIKIIYWIRLWYKVYPSRFRITVQTKQTEIYSLFSQQLKINRKKHRQKTEQSRIALETAEMIQRAVI